MSAHVREHEELLQRLFLGEPGGAELRGELAACPVCAAELERLERARAGLTPAFREERADLERARAEASPADEALVRRALAPLLPRAAPRRPVWPVAVAVLAAAALLAMFFLWRSTASRPAAPEILLDGGNIPCLEPIGPVDDYERFVWDFALPPGAHFELRIHEQEDGGKGTLVLGPITLTEVRWIPTAEERSALPDRIVWEVVARGVDGRQLERGTRAASRR